jgi:hypothetical protein
MISRPPAAAFFFLRSHTHTSKNDEDGLSRKPCTIGVDPVDLVFKFVSVCIGLKYTISILK